MHIGTSGSWTLSYSVEHLYVEFTPHKANQPLQGTELQEKEEKDDKHMKANLKELWGKEKHSTQTNSTVGQYEKRKCGHTHPYDI